MPAKKSHHPMRRQTHVLPTTTTTAVPSTRGKNWSAVMLFCFLFLSTRTTSAAAAAATTTSKAVARVYRTTTKQKNPRGDVDLNIKKGPALIIRIGFWGILFHNNSKNPPE